VTYFLTSKTMPDLQISDVRQMLALPLVSSRLSKPLISFQNNLLDGDLCKKYFISIFSLFFLICKHDFIRCVHT